MSRRIACLLTLLALLAGIAARREWASATNAPRAGLSRESVAATSRAANPLAERNEVSRAPARGREAPKLSARREFSLGADASAVLAEQVALKLLARNTTLTLSDETWAAFAEVTAHYQAIRHGYEASIATAGAAGKRRLEIPAYAAAGDALRSRLFRELTEKLGEGATRDIAQHLGPALEGHFAGFGVSVQTLEFTAGSDATDPAYQVTRTVNYWNATESSAKLTTRRETHFPGLEDPSGHTWGPFLSVLAAGPGQRTSS